jgi:phycocyanobilin:ferredoxin oxidoreductase
MNYKQTLDNTAEALQTIIEYVGTSNILPTENYGWQNVRFTSDFFRYAHIERYSDKNLEVLHFTCFPNEWCSDPIFGFDIITTDKKCLAAFMDMSPVDNKKTFNIGAEFTTPYKLPDWAKLIFSENVLAVVPTDDEFEMICDMVQHIFTEYLSDLASCKEKSLRVEYIKAAQNRYCENQQKNERTYSVLKAKLGADKAKYFMENILFPKIK